MSVPNTEAVRDWANAKFEEKVKGKGLSTNDYTNEDKALVDKIPVEMKATSEVSGIKSGILEGSADGKIISISAKAAARKSKNLFNPTLDVISKNGITCTSNGDGTYIVNGTATAVTTIELGIFSVVKGSTYKLNGLYSGGIQNEYTLYYASNNVSPSYANCLNSSGRTFVANSNDSVNVALRIPKDMVITNVLIKPMISIDTSLTYDDYEPYGIITPSDKVESNGNNLLDETGIKVYSSTIIKSEIITLKPNTTYICGTSQPQNTTYGANVFFCLPSDSFATGTNGVWINHTKTVTTGADGQVKVGYRADALASGKTMASYTYQINEGNELLPYTPYKHSSINLKKIIASFSPNGLPGAENEVVVYDDYTGEYIERSKKVKASNLSWEYVAGGNRIRTYLNDAKLTTDFSISQGLTSMLDFVAGNTLYNSNITGYAMYYEAGKNQLYTKVIDSNGNPITDVSAFLAQYGNMDIVYELATPIITPLTKDQVDAILKLSTFKDTTLINSEMSIDVKYYSSSNIGGAVAKVNENLNNATNVVNVLNNIKSAELTDSANGHISAISLYGTTHKSKNLIKDLIPSRTLNGITLTNNEDGTYTLNGTATANTYFNSSSFELKDGTYKLIAMNAPIENKVYGYVNAVKLDGSSQYNISVEPTAKTFVADSSKYKSYNAGFAVMSGETVNNLLVKLMLTTDLDATYADYEPYGLIIPSGKVESGTKNIFPFSLSLYKSQNSNWSWNGNTATLNGLSIEVLSDLRLKITGRPSTDAFFFLVKREGTNALSIPSGRYILSGCKHGGDNTYFLQINGTSENSGYIIAKNTTGDVTFDYSGDKIPYAFYFFAKANNDVNEIIEPMIRKASIEDNTYEPYAHSSINTKDIIANFDLVEVNGIRNEIHVFADGTGEKVERTKKATYDKNSNWVLGGTTATHRNVAVTKPSDMNAVIKNGYYNVLCDMFTNQNAVLGGVAIGVSLNFCVPLSITTLDEWKTYLGSNKINIVYEVTTPTVTPLTKAEVSAFLALQTYSDYTSIESDAEIDIEYYANSEIGQAVADVDSKVDEVSRDFEIKEQTLTNGIYVAKSGRVCELILENSSPITAGENVVIATIPEGFRPNKHISFVESFGNKRIIVAQNGNVTCSTALSGANIRGIATYLTNE